MSGTNGKRQYGLWLALALTVAITLWTALTDEDEAAGVLAQRPGARPPTAGAPRPPVADTRANSSRRAMRVADAAPASMVLDLTPLQQPRIGSAPGELFDNGLSPDKQAELAAATAPPKPTVPALPYTYAGKLIDGDRYIVFLTAGDKNYSVRVGDTLGDWRVKAIRPPQMILSYVPMQAEVPLKIGEAN